jgi:large subunit ribosomal protein L24
MALARVRRNDMVEVIAGRDKGKRGKVREVRIADGRAFVADLNIVKKHQKPIQGVRQAGIIDLEAPIDLSNLMPVCPACDKATRVGSRELAEMKRYASGRERRMRARFCKKCGEVFPEPKES